MRSFGEKSATSDWSLQAELPVVSLKFVSDATSPKMLGEAWQNSKRSSSGFVGLSWCQSSLLEVQSSDIINIKFVTNVFREVLLFGETHAAIQNPCRVAGQAPQASFLPSSDPAVHKGATFAGQEIAIGHLFSGRLSYRNYEYLHSLNIK